MTFNFYDLRANVAEPYLNGPHFFLKLLIPISDCFQHQYGINTVLSCDEIKMPPKFSVFAKFFKIQCLSCSILLSTLCNIVFYNFHKMIFINTVKSFV
jgi:hypothetical protein